MTTYKVEQSGRSHYVQGLKSEGFGEIPGEENALLIYRYPAGDIDTRMKDAHMMYGALYDLFQTHDGLKEGDIFQTEFGEYRCEGVHVLPNFEMGEDPRKEQRDNAHY